MTHTEVHNAHFEALVDRGAGLDDVLPFSGER